MRNLLVIASLLLAACGDSNQPGEPAPTPLPSGLARVDDEPAGANCAGGGAAIRTGIDDDGDGVLDLDEVDATRYVCDGETWHGDFGIEQWKDPAAVAALRRARAVTGYLVLDEDVDLPRLEVVGGQLGIGGSVSLPSLWLVTGDLVVAGTTSALRLPALTTVGGGITQYSSASLAALELPALTRVDGDVVLLGRIGRADLSRLVSIGGKLKVWSAGLGELRLDALIWIGGDLQLERVPDLRRLELPVLEGIAGSVSLAQWEGAIPLEALTAPKVGRIGAARFAGSTRLATLELGALTDVQGDFFLNAPALTRFTAPLERVGSPDKPSTLTIHGDALTAIDLPLAEARAIDLGGAALRTVRLPALRYTSAITVAGAQLESVSAPLVTGLDGLRIVAGHQPARIDFAALGDVRSLTLSALGLSDLSGLPSLRTIGESILIDLPLLTSLAGTQLTTARTLTITGVPLLTSVAGLEHLTAVTAQLRIQLAPRLTDLSALSALTQLGDRPPAGIAGDLLITDADALGDLHGLEGVTRAGDVTVLRCQHLSDLTALDHLTTVRSLEVSDNPALVSLAGLDHLTEATDSVAIYGDNGLTSLDGLRALTAIGGDLWIERQAHLGHLGLTALRTVGGALQLLHNPAALEPEIAALRAQLGRPALGQPAGR